MWITFLTFAAFVAIVLIVLLIYVKKGSANLTTVPGLEPSHPEEGNLKEITDAGGLAPFLQKLHQEFGPVASFWSGKEYQVSVGGSRALKDVTPLFDRPPTVIQMIKPLFGNHAIQSAKGEEGIQRHKRYGNSISSVNVRECFPMLNKICKELAKGWSERPADEHVLIKDEMFSLSLAMLFKTQLGSTNITEKEIKMIDGLYKEANDQIVAIMNGDKEHERHAGWNQSLKALHMYLKELLEGYSTSKELGDYDKAPVLEAIIEYCRNQPETEDFLTQELGDLTVFTVGGFHTTGLSLFWFFYYMSVHPIIQEQVFEELHNVLGDTDLTPETMPQLKFTRQVVDETLRVISVAPFTARCSDSEIMVGGHRIPPRMPIIIALNAILHDPEIYPQPNKFDPSRQSPDEVKKRPAWAFQPFGYGQRRCPGYYFTHAEMITAISVLVRRFRVLPADEEEHKDLGRFYSIFTAPDRDLWFKLEKR